MSTTARGQLLVDSSFVGPLWKTGMLIQLTLYFPGRAGTSVHACARELKVSEWIIDCERF